MTLRVVMALIGLVFLLAFAPPTWAQDPLVELSQPNLYDLQVVGFELTRGGNVDLTAVGRWPRESGDRRWWADIKDKFDESWDWDEGEENMSVYSWILDSKTREPVWVLYGEDTERYERSRTLRMAEVSLKLDAGQYELYQYSGHGWIANLRDRDNRKESSREWRRMSRDLEEVEEDLRDCRVTLTSSDLSGGDVRTFEVDGGLPGALFRATQLGDSQLVKQGFSLSQEGSVRIYATLEYGRGDDNAADFGWIVNADTGKRVWDGSDRRGKNAGGARKNRLIDRDVRLDAGRYMLYYGTDDSHSFEQFNANPPHDPLNWGITLLPGRDFNASSFSMFDVAERGEPLIDFSRARDGDFFERGFRLSRDADLHVYALGEATSDHWDFHDYGWIADAETGQTVWEMDDRNVVPAGGSEKNVMFDDLVRLPAGDYIAFYVADDSHAFDDWNSAAPFDGDAWGMRIYPSGGNDGGFALIAAEDLKRESGVLARIVRVGDHERERERFELTETTRVQIYALGEGSSGHMYDYGFIRDRERNRTVWEMDYRDTDHAGGASKNRMIDDEIELPAGTYEVVYETDGSHSFEGWNDRRPDDPMGWGITVKKAK